MVDESAKQSTIEEQENDRQVIFVSDLINTSLKVNETTIGQLHGENIIVGLLYVVAGIIASHPDEEYQLELFGQCDEILRIAYEHLQRIRRGSSH